MPPPRRVYRLSRLATGPTESNSPFFTPLTNACHSLFVKNRVPCVRFLPSRTATPFLLRATSTHQLYLGDSVEREVLKSASVTLNCLLRATFSHPLLEWN